MGTVLLVLVIVLVVAGLVYGVVSLLTDEDPGLVPVDPDGRARPLPNTRSLTEFDLQAVRFDVGLRGYRMTQVDRVLRRTAYDIGYKDEMIAVLEAEVIALREGRVEDAELLRKAREAAASTAPAPAPPIGSPEPGRAGGVHRAEPPARDKDDAVAGVSADESEAADEYDDFDDEASAATAPGRLNRSALPDLSAEPDHSPGSDAEPDHSTGTDVEPDHSPGSDAEPDHSGAPEVEGAAEPAVEEPEDADAPSDRGARG